MNKQRRKIIEAAINDLDAAKLAIEGALETFADALRSAASLAEQARDGEQDAYDNLSEGLQAGERGEAMQAAIEKLDEAVGILDGYSLADHIEETLSEVRDQLTEAME